MTRTTALLSLCLLSFTACMAPPVWRSPAYGPDSNLPTLAAASTYELYVPPVTINLDGVDLSELAEATAIYAEQNPEAFMQGVSDFMSSMGARSAAEDAVAAAGPSMHAKAMAFLESQGFAIEFDQERANKILGNGMGEEDETHFVAPGTAPNAFGSRAEADRPAGLIPIWGPGSKSDLRDRLSSGRTPEAYASVRATFTPTTGDPSKGVIADLCIQVLDSNAMLVFEGRTSAVSGPSGSAAAAYEAAFDQALAQMNDPIPYEG